MIADQTRKTLQHRPIQQGQTQEKRGPHSSAGPNKKNTTTPTAPTPGAHPDACHVFATKQEEHYNESDLSARLVCEDGGSHSDQTRRALQPGRY